MEIEDLLRRASAAPLGPLALTYVASDEAAWTLTITLAGKSSTVRARPDAASGGLILACSVDDPSSPAGAWVTATSTDAVSGRTERRLWLHGDGLSSNVLLNALSALAQVASTTEPAVVQPTIVIPPPPEEPEPVPLERPKPVGWNSFGFDRRETEPEEEPAVAAAPLPEAEPAAGAEPLSESETDVVASMPAPAEVAPDATPVAPAPAVTEAEPSQSLATAAFEAVPPAEAAGYCRECGSPYLPDHAFCTNCGARLN
jgi:hypothetical protein